MHGREKDRAKMPAMRRWILTTAVFLTCVLAGESRAADAPQAGDPVRIETVTGQIVEGELVEKLPTGYLIRVEVKKSETRVISYDLVKDIAKTDASAKASPTPGPAAPVAEPATPAATAIPRPVATPREPGTGFLDGGPGPGDTIVVGANLELRTFDYFGDQPALDGELRISGGRLIRGTHEIGGVLGYAIQQRKVAGFEGNEPYQDVSLTWLLAAYSFHRPIVHGQVPLVLYAGPLLGLVMQMATGVDTETNPAIGAQVGLLVQPTSRWAFDLRLLQADQIFSDDSYLILGTSVGARVSF